MATFFARGYRDELLQHRKKLRENPRVQEDVDHAWMALNLCVLEKKPRHGGAAAAAQTSKIVSFVQK